MPQHCDNTSVGVLITGGHGRYLMFDRATLPVGVAPPAGHVDDHGGFMIAASNEVSEELGLTVATLEYVTGGWRDNKCRRKPGPKGTGHNWQVYLATVAGPMSPSPRETRNARWLSLADIRSLAKRTADCATGKITAAEFAEAPGIEPVWCQWLNDVGLTDLPQHDLTRISRLAAGR